MRRADVLEAMRGDPSSRPAPDPDLIGAARAHLEAAAAAWAAVVPPGVVVRVTKDAVTSVRHCETRHMAELADRSRAGTRVVPAVLRGRLVDALFRQVATTSGIGQDAISDALEGCEAEGEPVSLATLDASAQEQVRAEVGAAAAVLAASWPDLPVGSAARTQERLLVTLAGGRVVLSGRPDLAIGRPTRLRAGVVVVEAKSGRFRPAHLDELRFYSLLEALRWGVAPFRALVWSLGDGRIEALEIDAELLWSETLRVADAITRLTRLAAGEEPRASANPLCPSCPLLEHCPDGTRQVTLASGCAPTEDGGDDDAEEDGDAVDPGP